MPKLGKKLLVGILFLQLTEQQKSIHNAGLYSHRKKSSKTSALPKIKGLIFHLETSFIPYVIASPAQTSAITSFLQKNSYGALISSFQSGEIPCSMVFSVPGSFSGLRNTWRSTWRSTSLSHSSTAPSFVKISLLAGCKTSIDLFARISAFVLDPLPTHPYLSLNMCFICSPYLE